MTRLDIGSLEAICAIADHGGITRAASHLALSQSAISHKVKRLEDGLGYGILDRRAGGSKFTPEGEQLLTYGRRILAIHEEALSNLARKPLKGRIRLGMTEDMANNGLPEILGRFKRHYPDIAVTTTTAQSLHIEQQLDRREIDIGVMDIFEHQKRPSDAQLRHTPLHWVKAPDYPLDLAKPVPFLAFAPDCFYHHWAMQSGLPDGCRLETILTCASSNAIISAVSAQLGIALVGEHCLTNNIAIITDIFPQPPSVATIIRTSRNAHNAAVRALKDSITSTFSTRRASALPTA
ncbi:LysR family transcriptional regulator [Thalassospira sp. TSL5-1]|uniref:LysR family transcriptional regulator n=1 Tax=Thalassospira sp. TSL5-1 TaxID=1544451 RepID=UPI0009405018|nr:LysR family transcriptional regulator [Thalassospira sp. TSL5-1]